MWIKIGCPQFLEIDVNVKPISEKGAGRAAHGSRLKAAEHGSTPVERMTLIDVKYC